MLKADKLKVGLLVLLFILFVNISGVLAQDGCVVPTTPKEVSGITDWVCKPDIKASSDTVARNNYVNVWVDCKDLQGKGCPKFTWSVSGTGFHFGSVSGPTTATTDVDLEIVRLYADGTACGAATITVTDECGETSTGHVRCKTGGWALYCQGANWAQTCAGRKDYVKYPDPETQIILGVGCHYHLGIGSPPYRCVFFSCGGYTSYLPEPPGVLLCGTRNYVGVHECKDFGYQGCRYYSVYLTVYKWECP